MKGEAQMAEPMRDPAEIVTGFLRSLEARDVAAAKARTAPGFTMQFPGAVSFTDFAELFAWSRQRYTGVRKSFERIDVAHKDGIDTVHISGMLSGTWLDGTTFGDIRYLDRFDIKDGRIVRQTVWNDMGEARLARGTAHGAATKLVDSTTSARVGTGAATGE